MPANGFFPFHVAGNLDLGKAVEGADLALNRFNLQVN